MSKRQIDDKMLMTELLGSTAQREKALRYIFSNLEWKTMCIRYVQLKGGNEQDGEDVFQEAIILFDRNIREDRYKGESSLQTYFMAIAKWYWWGQWRKRRPQEELSPAQHDAQTEGVEARLLADEKKNFLRQALEKLGDRCKQVLELYQLHYSMEEIAIEAGFSGPDMAKKEAYQCRKKLKNFFDNNPDWVNRVK